MVRLKLVIEKMQSLNLIKEEGIIVPDMKKLWREQSEIAQINKFNQFAPVEQVLKATDFVIVNTEQSQRDKILIYGAIREATYRKDRIVVPLCYFDDDRFTIV